MIFVYEENMIPVNDDNKLFAMAMKISGSLIKRNLF